MNRRIVALLAGLISGGIVVAIIEGISSLLHPLPENLDASNFEQLKAFVATLPASAFCMVLLAHLLGAFIAGLVFCLIAKQRWTFGALVLGALFLVAGAVNLWMIPHPLWFGVVDIFIYLPASFCGAMSAGRLLSRPSLQSNH